MMSYSSTVGTKEDQYNGRLKAVPRWGLAGLEGVTSSFEREVASASAKAESRIALATVVVQAKDEEGALGGG